MITYYKFNDNFFKRDDSVFYSYNMIDKKWYACWAAATVTSIEDDFNEITEAELMLELL